MEKLETSIYIIGSKNNWQIRKGHLITLSCFITFLVVTLSGIIAYQYFFHQFSLEDLQISLAKEKTKSQTLENKLLENSERYSNQIENFKTKLEEKEALFATINPSEQNYSQQILALEQEQTKKNELIQKLETEKQEYLRQINTLLRKVDNLNAKIVQKVPESTSTSPELPKVVTIENFANSLENGNLKVTFALRNTTETIQSGYIGVTIANNESSPIPPFNSLRGSSFSIRRFRPFTFTLKNSTTASKIQIIVWNQEQDVLLNEFYDLE